MPHIPELQYECFTCEQYFTRTSALADGVPIEYAMEYCTKECLDSFYATLQAGAAESVALKLDTSESTSGNAKDAVFNLAQKYNLRLSKE
jgi:hypothetical protein